MKLGEPTDRLVALVAAGPLVILGRAPGGPEGATYIGEYCFWTPAS